MQKVDYSNAYSEVLEVLNYVSIEEYNKIPKKFIVYMEENCDENNEFVYNIALPFNRQAISEEAKNILAMIYRLFWATDQKKKELNKMDKQILQKKEIQNRERYNPDNLFKNNRKQTDIEGNMVVYKKSILERIRDKIKSLFHK